jgi:hypothetical protein
MPNTLVRTRLNAALEAHKVLQSVDRKGSAEALRIQKLLPNVAIFGDRQRRKIGHTTRLRHTQ